MNVFDLLIPAYVTLFVGMIGFLLFRSWKSRGKLKALILKPNMQYSVSSVGTKGHFLKFNKHWKPEFAPQDVFIEQKPPLKFWRRPNLMVVIAENARKALKWEKETVQEGKTQKTKKEMLVSKLKHLWTDEELIQFAEKEAIMAEMKIKPYNNLTLYLLIAIIIFNIFLTFYGFNRIGVF